MKPDPSKAFRAVSSGKGTPAHKPRVLTHIEGMTRARFVARAILKLQHVNG